MAVYVRGSGRHVAERVRPAPGSEQESRLEGLVASGAGWRRLDDEPEPGPAGPPAGGGEGGSGPGVVQRPARSAPKADWMAYAHQVAPEGAGIDGLTKDELIDRYGKGEG